MTKIFFTCIIFTFCVMPSIAQTRPLNGFVKSVTAGVPLEGATVHSTINSVTITTGVNGQFNIQAVAHDILIVSHTAYLTKKISVDTLPENAIVFLETAVAALDSVVIYTGYEEVKKAKATGSYATLDNVQINRNTSASIMDRIDGLVSSLYIDHRPGNTDAPLQIRGVSGTGFASTRPLIILDNFPYEGDINNINPSDVENVTFLKDAAASAIWGARAGNGVIVITTKKGKFNQPVRVSLNTTFTISSKPDLFAMKDMTPSEYIDIEKFLFNKGYYNSSINNTRSFPPLSPIVDILVQQKSGKISEAEAEHAINAYRQNDVRKDFQKYLYRKASRQNYSVNLDGGAEKMNYHFNAGYDRALDMLKGNGNNRYTINTNATLKPSKHLQFDFGVSYIELNNTMNSPGGYQELSLKEGRAMYPYARFADDEGNPIPFHIYLRGAYEDTAGAGKLLPWTYNPIDQLNNNDMTGRSQTLILNSGLSYKILRSLSAEIKYQYLSTYTSQRFLYNLETYEARQLLNMFTHIDGDEISYAVPLGAFLYEDHTKTKAHNLRGQLNFERKFDAFGYLKMIVGAELRDLEINSSSGRTYGYNDKLNFVPVDYVNLYPILPTGSAMIPSGMGLSQTADRYTSLYGNLLYNYANINISGSIRKDASNLLGVNANKRAVPLWSAGVSWILSKENFYKSGYFPFLKLRATYGFSGNVSNAYTAVTTIQINPGDWQPVTGLPYANIENYANPNLSWEKVGITNLGVDFENKDGRLTGSIEYYLKHSTNVLGSAILSPTWGITYLTTNMADLKGYGWDITINSKNIETKSFKWQTSLMFGFNKSKITKLRSAEVDKGYINNGLNLGAIDGLEPFSIVSYKWAGLDALGNPQGYANGEKSNNYSLLFALPLSDQVVIGTGIPHITGSLLNSVNWKGLELSFNVLYQFGYYFRRNTLSYIALFGKQIGNEEFSKRWQRPGDEYFTNVPSMIYPNPSRRDAFYNNSEITVEKGDHISLKDIRLSYDLSKSILNKSPFRLIQLYGYVSDINFLLWKANKLDIDPQYPSGLKPPASYSIGLHVNF